MAVSEGVCPCGNRYSSRLHFGMFSAGKGEEKGMAAMKERSKQASKMVSMNKHDDDDDDDLGEGETVLRQRR